MCWPTLGAFLTDLLLPQFYLESRLSPKKPSLILSAAWCFLCSSSCPGGSRSGDDYPGTDLRVLKLEDWLISDLTKKGQQNLPRSTAGRDDFHVIPHRIREWDDVEVVPTSEGANTRRFFQTGPQRDAAAGIFDRNISARISVLMSSMIFSRRCPYST